MIIKLKRRFFALLFIVFVALLLPEITVVSANSSFNSSQVIFTSHQVIFTSHREDTKDTITFSEDDLTPQEHQKLQAVRQRRNKEILAVLNSAQRKQLAHYLHTDNDLIPALNGLDLTSEQQEIINAVIQLTNLKLRGIFYNHALLVGNKSSLLIGN
jgi:prolyl oligopeptidase PreP (S9A serine peptidase family)